MANIAGIMELYTAYFNRAADKNGVDYWANEMDNNGWTLDDVANTFAQQPEYTALYDGKTNQEIVDLVYTNVLNRDADAAGAEYWLAELDSGAVTVSQFILAVVNSATEMVDGVYKHPTDAAIVNNKTAVSQYAYDTNSNATDISLAGVTEDEASTQSAKNQIDAENPANIGETFTLTTSPDTFVGTAKNDTVTGTTLTLQDTDTIIDQSTTDNDTLDLTLTSAISAANTNKAKVSGIENVNITISNTAAAAVDAGNFAGVKNLTVTRADVTVGGSTIVGNKVVTVNDVNADNIAKVTTGTGTTDVVLTQKTKAGVTIDASTATGTVTVDGATTLSADNATGAITLNNLTVADTTEDAKAVTVNAAKASSVATDVLFTGAITINAAAAKGATAIVVNNAEGGATIVAGTTSTDDTTIAVSGIDDTGATITTGTGSSVAAEKQIVVNLDGKGTSDVATVSAAGYITLDVNNTNLVETINLSGNGAAVKYVMTDAPTTYNLTGDQDVTVSNTAANLTLKTLTDSTTAGTTTVEITSGDNADLSKIAADKIILKDDGTSADYTLASNANLVIAADQTDLTVIGKTASSTVNVSTADDTAANGTTIDLTVGAFVASSNVSTLNLDATIGKFTATSTTLDVTGTDATTLNITGTKDVALGTTSAKTVVATGLTGALTASLNNAAVATSVTSGSGSDDLTFNDTNSSTTVYTVDAGNGDNTLTITNAKEASSFATGTGDDTITITGTAAYVVVTGAGNDKVTVVGNSDSIIAMGDGTSDEIIFASAQDFTNNSNFAISGVEKVTTAAGGTVTISAAQFANENTFQLLGTSATADILRVTGDITGSTETAGVTIDASGITFATTQNAKLELAGTNFVDTITGSAKNDTIIASMGADVINGGAGTDTYDATALYNVKEVLTATNASSGVVINLGTTAVTNTTILASTVGYTADSVTSVASNTVAYVYGSSHTTNSAVTQSLAGIENVIGTNGADYIVGSVSANVIDGGKGADSITGGAGNDTIVIGNTDSGITLATADTIFGFALGNDKLSLGVAGDATAGTGNYVEVADAAYASFALALAAGNSALTTLAGTSAATELFAVVGDTTSGDTYLFNDIDGDGTADQVIVLDTIGIAGIAATDIIA